MKVVINGCYGGFGISRKALLMLIKINAKCVEKTEVIDYYGGSEKYKDKPCYNINWRSDFEDNMKDSEAIEGKFKTMGAYSSSITDGVFVYNMNDDCREDEDLIRVVKELGDKVNGNFAELQIVEIPDGVEYEIDEYDGFESIHEKHRSWY